MNLLICENIKDLRRKKDTTQEDLAEFLTVSISAVSKWERGECYPDIELLPKIAAYFDVTVDDLLGVGEIRKKERIAEYQEKSNQLNHIGDRKGDLELWREAQKEFPNDWTVLHFLMYALTYIDEKEHSEEIIQIGEKILAQCTANNYRYGAMQILCFHYQHLGDLTKAKEYAEMAPSFYVTRDLLLIHALEGDERILQRQYNIVELAELLGQEIDIYAWRLSGEEKKHAHLTAIKVYELIYENGDFGFYACRMSQIYSKLTRIAAEEQNKIELLSYLANAIKYAIIYDTQEDFQKTSLFVNHISHNSKSSTKDYMSNDSYLRLKELDDPCYDFIREDEEFTRLTEELKGVAKGG